MMGGRDGGNRGGGMGGDGGMGGNMMGGGNMRGGGGGGGGGGAGVSQAVLNQLGIEGPISNSLFVSNVSKQMLNERMSWGIILSFVEVLRSNVNYLDIIW